MKSLVQCLAHMSVYKCYIPSALLFGCPGQAGCEGISMEEVMNKCGSEPGACLPQLPLQGILPKDKRKEFHLVNAFYVPDIGTMSQI